MIIGFDEVGRGALAGPVMTGAVLLEGTYPKLTYSFAQKNQPEKTWENELFEELKVTKDSKQLKITDRKKVVQIAQKLNLNGCVLSASNHLIDNFGIGVCLSHLLIISIQNIIANIPNTSSKITVIADGKIKLLPKLNPELTEKIKTENELKIEIDLDYYGNLINKVEDLFEDFEQEVKVEIIRENKADDKYLSVAIASNLAKVKRDNLMVELAKEYPQFGWETNVGYATKINREAIKNNLDNPHLRRTWIHD